MKEAIGRNQTCPLCGKQFAAGTTIPAGTSTFVHEKAGRVHLFCSFKEDLWRKWMQKVGLIPTPIEIDVIDESKKDS